MIDIGLILKGLRKEHNFTQAQLAKRMGVSITTVGGWENEFKFPSVEHLVALSKLYHVPLNYVVGIEKEPSIVLDDLTQAQQNLLKTLVLEFQDRSKNKPGLTERQKDILNDIIIIFSAEE